eukprot:CAMPEP_0117018656 /NCGR_PEP_ID=MMETSP0472-20121206/14397_1 /TAXON_ID=693140 ORGANISM="Tiarina fusus, Strain LIS" /NCGR_SAMPLE_ID=MMETSP0472 /ASSEMBLY_ACC=CAM_ASM_000603 /LENGTH=115 /DNA_ID=CAMNT_0004723365 /DNA_START=322 /DNA_END=666 /DNA_ORIENTATION=+
MDEVLLVDIDNDSFILSPTENPNEDVDIIPPCYIDPLRKLIKKSAKLVKRTQKRRKENKLEEEELRQFKYEMSLLAAGFVDFFVATVGAYGDFINNGEFDREGFLSLKPELRPFL